MVEEGEVFLIFRGWWWKVVGGREGQGIISFLEFGIFFDIQFKNTSNLIFPGFMVPSKRFFPENFKTGLTF